MERLNRDLLERIDGLTSLLKQLDVKSKSATAKAKHYRERLSAAEAGPDCLPIVYQCTRTHSPHPLPWPGHSFRSSST